MKTKLIKTHHYDVREEGLACKIKVADIASGKDIETKFSPICLDHGEWIDIWGEKDANQFVGGILNCNDTVNCSTIV